MVKPFSLKYIPKDFADMEGIPFTLNSRTKASYLSLKYPVWAIEAISSIGVSELSPQDFLTDLNSFITLDPTAFRAMSVMWHSQLANSLTKLATNAELLSIIQDLCIIPLHDGSWTPAGKKPIFFSKSETSLEIPSGIEVLIVDSAAESDLNRRKLFVNLGVVAWEAPEICRLILKVHDSPTFKPEELAVQQLISHAAFLYSSWFRPPKIANLWFATMQDGRFLGGNSYLPVSGKPDSAAARIYAKLQMRFPVIHKDYIKAFPEDVEGPSWIISNLGVSNIPRLTIPHVDPKPQPVMEPGSVTPNEDEHENFDVDSDESKKGFSHGDQVAFRYDLKGSDRKPVWLLGQIERALEENLSLGPDRRFEIRSPDQRSPYSYCVSASSMLHIPPEGATSDLPEVGKCVLALHPDSKTFHYAEVERLLNGDAGIEVRFKENTASSVVDRRYVLSLKRFGATHPLSLVHPSSSVKGQVTPGPVPMDTGGKFADKTSSLCSEFHSMILMSGQV
jgi:hypothetical protein